MHYTDTDNRTIKFSFVYIILKNRLVLLFYGLSLTVEIYFCDVLCSVTGVTCHLLCGICWVSCTAWYVFGDRCYVSCVEWQALCVVYSVACVRLQAKCVMYCVACIGDRRNVSCTV